MAGASRPFYASVSIIWRRVFLATKSCSLGAFIRALPGECATVAVWNGNMAVGSVVCRSRVNLVIDVNRVLNFPCLLGSGKLLEVSSLLL